MVWTPRGCARRSGSPSRGCSEVRYRLVVLAVLLTATTSFSGCARDTPPAASRPSPPVLTTPIDAVRSYLDWISYAYRVSDSDVASATFSPSEEVRVNSYVEYNRERGRAIEQHLTHLGLEEPDLVGTRTTVTGQESWRYRYISLRTSRYLGGWLTATYDTTYTVVRERRGWVVDRVEAQPRGPVK